MTDGHHVLIYVAACISGILLALLATTILRQGKPKWSASLDLPRQDNFPASIRAWQFAATLVYFALVAWPMLLAPEDRRAIVFIIATCAGYLLAWSIASGETVGRVFVYTRKANPVRFWLAQGFLAYIILLMLLIIWKWF